MYKFDCRCQSRRSLVASRTRLSVGRIFGSSNPGESTQMFQNRCDLPNAEASHEKPAAMEFGRPRCICERSKRSAEISGFAVTSASPCTTLSPGRLPACLEMVELFCMSSNMNLRCWSEGRRSGDENPQKALIKTSEGSNFLKTAPNQVCDCSF